MKSAAEAVEAGIVAGRAGVRVVGRGSFRSASALRHFALAAIEQGTRDVVCDLTDCLSMDSTFIGVLAQIGLDLKRQEGGTLTLWGLSPKLDNGLRTLGLDRLAALRAAEAGSSAMAGAPLRPLDLGAGATDRTFLDAHVALADLSEENRERFRGVIQCLTAEQDRAAPPEDTP